MAYDKERFEKIYRLIELEKEELQLAIEVVEELGVKNSEKYPEELKKKISNAVALLHEIDDFYGKALETEFEEMNN